MTENQTTVHGTPPAPSAPRQGQLGALSGAECLELLERNEVGRVSFVTTNGPHIYPVNYAMDEGTIVIRTSPYAGLFTSTSGLVGFEIDEIDVTRRQGWSVLVIGTVAVLFIPIVARTVRAAVLAERNLDYVTSARLRGENTMFIVGREILPNVVPALAQI